MEAWKEETLDSTAQILLFRDYLEAVKRLNSAATTVNASISTCVVTEKGIVLMLVTSNFAAREFVVFTNTVVQTVNASLVILFVIEAMIVAIRVTKCTVPAWQTEALSNSALILGSCPAWNILCNNEECIWRYYGCNAERCRNANSPQALMCKLRGMIGLGSTTSWAVVGTSLLLFSILYIAIGIYIYRKDERMFAALEQNVSEVTEEPSASTSAT
ncbi:hypothetical protein B566_EDAN018262, partial [Ephemera danica]